MKKFLFIPLLLICGLASAGDIVSPLKGNPDSFYDVAHSTVAISSTTVTTDVAVVGYRAVYIYNLSTVSTAYYYLGAVASTTTVTTNGWPIFPWRGTSNPIPEKIEYNGLISYRLIPGSTSSIDVTKKVLRR